MALEIIKDARTGVTYEREYDPGPAWTLSHKTAQKANGGCK